MKRVMSAAGDDRPSVTPAVPSEAYQAEYERLEDQLMSPPDGWVAFGSHVDKPGVPLEFWGEVGGLPIWERPVPTTVPARGLGDDSRSPRARQDEMAEDAVSAPPRRP